jgi:hypothetical protein
MIKTFKGAQLYSLSMTLAEARCRCRNLSLHWDLQQVMEEAGL